MTTLHPDPRPAVLVLGANGRFGLAAVRAFAAAGWRVVAHTRRAPRAPWPAGVREVRCDALDVPALVAAGRGAAVIVQALNPTYTEWAEQLPPLTAAAIELAAATGARLMLPGNVYPFGRALPPVLTEATPFVGDHEKAAQRIAQEAALCEAAGRGVKSVVIRAGDFLGDGVTWFDQGVARRLARGVVTHLGPEDLEHAWAWLPDLAQVFVRVAERRDALPPFKVLHHEGLTLTGRQLHAALEAELGRPLARAAFPWWQLRLAAPFAAMPRALLAMRYLWQRPHRLDGTKLAALIGPVPHTPLATVVRQCVATLPQPAAPATARPALRRP